MAKLPRENRIPIMMSHDELRQIDDWRFENRVATRSDAVRRLCQIGLAALARAAELNNHAVDGWDESNDRLDKLADKIAQSDLPLGDFADDLLKALLSDHDELERHLVRIDQLFGSLLPLAGGRPMLSLIKKSNALYEEAERRFKEVIERQKAEDDDLN